MNGRYDGLRNDEVIEEYGDLLDELKKRNILRTHNLVGDIGEHKAIDFYNKSSLLPNLKAMEIGMKYVDAVSDNDERYSIKTTTTKMTGVFNGLNDINSDLPQNQLFEYVIIVVLNKKFSVQGMYQLNWQSFMSLKKWNRSKRTYYLTISNELKRKSKIIYEQHT